MSQKDRNKGKANGTHLLKETIIKQFPFEFHKETKIKQPPSPCLKKTTIKQSLSTSKPLPPPKISILEVKAPLPLQTAIRPYFHIRLQRPHLHQLISKTKQLAAISHKS